MLQKIYDSLLTLTFPQICQVCQNSVENSADGAACCQCWKNTRIFSGNEILCKKCGAYLRDSEISVTTFCHRCDEHFYDAAKSVGLYEKALAASILNLKREPFLPKTLQRLFLSAFENSDFQPIDLIVPVPLSKKRRLERGFNQSEILAEFISKKTGIKSDDKSLVREIHTPIHRAAMDKKAREATVKNAFAVKRPNLIENNRILLIDDVFTSGATVSSCAEVLKKHGAGEVFILTIARAV